ncbi:MAG: glycosyltransferase family 4 protein [Planctomycetota bacterium]
MSNSKPRLVFLNRSYWPDIEATGQLLTDLCVGLSNRFDVHVICGQPNQPEREAVFAAAGHEIRHGVTIHRLEHRRFQKKNGVGRILNLVSFYRAADRYLRQWESSADVVVSETDPFLLPLAGDRFARRVGAPHVAYLQDIYPDVAEAVGKSRIPMVGSAIRHQLRRVYHRAERVVVLGTCMSDRLTDSPWDVPRHKVEIIPNWADCGSIQPIAHDGNAFRKRVELDDSFVVMHSGNMGLTQRLEVLIEAAAEPHWPTRAKLLLVGNGASRDQLIAKKEALNLTDDRVRFVNYQPREELAHSLSAADLHIVSMHENITGCLCPSKLYGIMAAGRSILGIADPRTDLCRTIKEHQLGWCVPPGSPAAVAKAVADAERQITYEGELNRRAREGAERHYDRDVIVERFTHLLIDCLSGERELPDAITPHVRSRGTDVAVPV